MQKGMLFRIQHPFFIVSLRYLGSINYHLYSIYFIDLRNH